MSNEIILQGVSLDDFKTAVREVMREEREEKEPLKKAEACRRLRITYPTLNKRMQREGIKHVTTGNLQQLQK